MTHAEQIAGLLLSSRHVIILTGAGISTDSGIPDFRSPETGLWQQYDPIEVLSVDALYNRSDVFFNVGFKILTTSFKAEPNKSHELISEFQKAGLVQGIVTQNIDSLHQKAGSTHVMEVHGHLRTCHCMRCHKTFPTEEVEKKVNAGEIPPKCSCGGILRPDVILFGDSMPSVLNEAISECRHSDLVIVLGSSLTVAPVCQLPLLAKRMVIINREVTPFDSASILAWHGGITDALTEIRDCLKKLSPQLDL